MKSDRFHRMSYFMFLRVPKYSREMHEAGVIVLWWNSVCRLCNWIVVTARWVLCMYFCQRTQGFTQWSRICLNTNLLEFEEKSCRGLADYHTRWRWVYGPHTNSGRFWNSLALEVARRLMTVVRKITMANAMNNLSAPWCIEQVKETYTCHALWQCPHRVQAWFIEGKGCMIVSCWRLNSRQAFLYDAGNSAVKWKVVLPYNRVSWTCYQSSWLGIGDTSASVLNLGRRLGSWAKWQENHASQGTRFIENLRCEEDREKSWWSRLKFRGHWHGSRRLCNRILEAVLYSGLLCMLVQSSSYVGCRALLDRSSVTFGTLVHVDTIFIIYRM